MKIANLSALVLLAVLLITQIGLAHPTPLPAPLPQPHRPVASVPDDVYWDDRFAPRGVNGNVFAFAVSGDDVYIGGAFTTVGNIVANGIARWNTTTQTWSALGEGVTFDKPYSYGAVYAIAISGDDVYVGGYFMRAGNVAANYIARWNATTQTWSAVGSGTNGSVQAIAVSGSEVYVGGYFTSAGGIAANSIAKWDAATNTWSALGSGVVGMMTAQSPLTSPASTPLSTVTQPISPPTSTPVRLPTAIVTVPPPPPKISSVGAIAISGDDVYVGGNFVTAGGVTANGIARWNRVTQTWSALGSGMIGTRNYPSVNAIAINGSDVYVGGSFSAAGGVSASGIAKWDTLTNTWSAVGNGIGGSTSPTVYALVTSGNAVYVGGAFATAGNIAANNIAKWDVSTNTWAALGSGTNEAVLAIGIVGSSVYAGGSFLMAGGNSVAHLARWDAGIWSAFDTGKSNGIVGYVYTVATGGSDVYVGGTFTTAGRIAANCVARWDGSAWSALGDGVNGKVLAIAVSGNDVYVGGSFTTAGGVNANNIARWNASTNTWSALGSGVDSSVNAIVISGDNVYVGGNFTSAGGITASRIARWNTTTQTWSALGTGVGGSTYSPQVYAIATSGDEVYVGGNFITAGNVIANRIARWNAATQTWSALGSGIGDTYGVVYAIALGDNAVYVGGTFTSIGGVSANNIARWNTVTQTWSAIGGSLSTRVSALAFSNGNVYAGGSPRDTSTNLLARWDGCVWSPLGSGVNNFVSALAASGDDVYVVGNFTTAGSKPSNHFAHWNKPTAPVVCHTYYFPFVSR